MTDLTAKALTPIEIVTAYEALIVKARWITRNLPKLQKGWLRSPPSRLDADDFYLDIKGNTATLSWHEQGDYESFYFPAELLALDQDALEAMK